MGPWTFAWICCLQLPCHPCKNGTHGPASQITAFSNRKLQNATLTAGSAEKSRNEVAISKSQIPNRSVFQKAREGCGCPKFLAGKVFWQIATLLENASPIFRQREMLSLPRFGHFPARKTAAGKLAAPAGTQLDFLLRDRHSLLEFFCCDPGGLLENRFRAFGPKQETK